MDVREFRLGKGLQSQEIVKVVNKMYPRYDKYLQSKVERPEKYGIRLTAEAEKLLEEVFGSGMYAPRKKEKRRLAYRLSFRTTKTVYTQLQYILKSEGFNTIQACLTHIVNFYFENQSTYTDESAAGGREHASL